MFNTYFYPLYIVLLVLGGSFIFYRFIYAPYKYSLLNNDFEELITILNIIMNTQIDVYEKNVFSKRKGLTNATYENYFREISIDIYNALPKKFFKKMESFLTEDAVMTLISRRVRDYLIEKMDPFPNQSEDE